MKKDICSGIMFKGERGFMKKIWPFAMAVLMLCCLCLPINAEHSRGELPGELIYDFSDASLAGGRELKISAEVPTFGLGNYFYVCAEVYVGDISRLSDTCAFTISSSPKDRVQELSVNLSKYGLKNGWNTVFIYIPDFRISGYMYDNSSYEGVCDIMNICRITLRWYAKDATGGADIRLGRISATDSNTSVAIPEGKYSVGNGAIAMTDHACSGSAVASGSKELVRLIPSISGGSVDISSKKYIYFWLYVSDVKLDGSVSTESFELCSGGACDINENSIRINGGSGSLCGTYGKLKSGWNEFLVPVSLFNTITNKSGSPSQGCDFSAVNYIRIYFRSAANTAGKEVVYAVSPIYAVNKEDLIETSVTTTTMDTQFPTVTTAPPETTDAPETTLPQDTSVEPSKGCSSSIVTSFMLSMICIAAVTAAIHRKND